MGAFVLAVLANICYCTAYLGDVFVQVSGFRESWLKWRWVILLIGISLRGDPHAIVRHRLLRAAPPWMK